MTSDANYFDLSSLSYDEFLSYFFINPTVDKWGEDAQGKPYWLPDMSAPLVIAHHVTKLCLQFDNIARRFSLPSLDGGFDGMFGVAFFHVQSALWKRTVALEDRRKCIESMYQVFAGFIAVFGEEELPSSLFMWWDHICTDFWFSRRDIYKLDSEDYASLDQDDKLIVDAMFQTLCNILQLDDDRAKSCALHGLGHLHHPGVYEVVQAFIDNLPVADRTSDSANWLKKCRDGTVM